MAKGAASGGGTAWGASRSPGWAGGEAGTVGVAASPTQTRTAPASSRSQLFRLDEFGLHVNQP